MNLKQLIEKYAANGPRYTSYPTAAHFAESENKEALIDLAVNGSNALSLYVHIPFCASQCFFCACSSSVCLDISKADTYLDALDAELKLWQNRGLDKKTLEQIHFGGGTPNFLSVPQIYRLNKIIEKYFEKSPLCEFSAELDPRTLTDQKIKAFADIGVNRASIGLQDTNDFVQKAINRVQPQSMNIATFQALRNVGITHINADLIYGLPLQTLKAFEKTLSDVLQLNPTRISLFNYAHVPWMKTSQKALEKYEFVSANEKVECFLLAKQTFENAGFLYIGLDHFAKPQDELVVARLNGTLQRNFQGYSTHAGIDGFGIGLTSISQTKDSYRQNRKDMQKYYDDISKGVLPVERGVVLTADDILRRKAIMSIMCLLKVSESVFEPSEVAEYKRIFDAARPRLVQMQADGLLEFDGEYSFRLLDFGRVFMRNIAMLFDGRSFARHSKTV